MALMRAVGPRRRPRGDPLRTSYLLDMTMTFRAGASWHEACKASAEYRRQRRRRHKVLLRTGQATPPPWGQTLSSAGGGFFIWSTASSGASGVREQRHSPERTTNPNDHHWNHRSEVPPRIEPPRLVESNRRHRRARRFVADEVSRGRARSRSRRT